MFSIFSQKKASPPTPWESCHELKNVKLAIEQLQERLKIFTQDAETYGANTDHHVKKVIFGALLDQFSKYIDNFNRDLTHASRIADVEVMTKLVDDMARAADYVITTYAEELARKRNASQRAACYTTDIATLSGAIAAAVMAMAVSPVVAVGAFVGVEYAQHYLLQTTGLYDDRPKSTRILLGLKDTLAMLRVNFDVEKKTLETMGPLEERHDEEMIVLEHSVQTLALQ